MAEGTTGGGSWPSYLYGDQGAGRGSPLGFELTSFISARITIDHGYLTV